MADEQHPQPTISHGCRRLAHGELAQGHANGALTTLVNNVAPTDLVGPGRGDRSLAEITYHAWDTIMTVALKQLVWCARHAVPHLGDAESASIARERRMRSSTECAASAAALARGPAAAGDPRSACRKRFARTLARLCTWTGRSSFGSSAASR